MPEHLFNWAEHFLAFRQQGRFRPSLLSLASTAGHLVPRFDCTVPTPVSVPSILEGTSSTQLQVVISNQNTSQGRIVHPCPCLNRNFSVICYTKVVNVRFSIMKGL